ncbi:4487_t:CDS:1, partial [Paraglomus brasilianum]
MSARAGGYGQSSVASSSTVSSPTKRPRKSGSKRKVSRRRTQ